MVRVLAVRWFAGDDMDSRTSGFALKHWKAIVRSSVSRAVKAVGVLEAIVGLLLLVGWRDG